MLIKTAEEIVMIEPEEVIGFLHNPTGNMLYTADAYTPEYEGHIITIHGTIKIYGSHTDIYYVRTKLLQLLNKLT